MLNDNFQRSIRRMKGIFRAVSCIWYHSGKTKGFEGDIGTRYAQEDFQLGTGNQLHHLREGCHVSRPRSQSIRAHQNQTLRASVYSVLHFSNEKR